VARFVETLGAIASDEAPLWALGVDMAHLGRRYGDPFPAQAGQGALVRAEERDRERIGTLLAGDADGFWSLVQEGDDDLRWCGASALYTFLKAVSPAGGALLRYEQWNIDPESVVTFGALAYGAPASAGD
jgi:predicted class III extradiol MEMO1 family dioxygenase